MEFRLQDLPLEPSEEIFTSGYDRMYKYLADRGITHEAADQLGIRPLRCKDIGKLGDERGALVFPHFTAGGEELDWWSARLVDIDAPRKASGFGALVLPQARGKMFCPPKHPPAAYLVPTLDWTAIPEGATIYIHESCIKAIAGARCERYSVGLNGVWGWGSKKHEIALLSQLRDLPWTAKRLDCVVVFDSNADSNDDVALAIRRFAERMQLICKVRVRHLLLPKPPESLGLKDWGFDDYCAHFGDEEGQLFLDRAVTEEGAAVEVEISELETLKLQLNEEVCVVRALKRVADQESGVLMGRSEFCDMNYAHYTAWVQEGERERQVNVPKLWLQWERRRVVEALEYMPGRERLHDGLLNLWRPSGVEPLEGDVSRWLQILEHNVSDPALRKWIIQWMAYPIQNPGAKLRTYCHIYGPPGTGKQAILEPLFRIYGRRNSVIIGREHLASDFNSVYANKQLINVDEIHSPEGAVGLAIGNKLKKLVASPTLVVNRKGDPEYEVSNCAQVVTTSNYVSSIKLDDDDRRACVVKFGERGSQLPTSFWQEYYRWIESGGGDRMVLHYLLAVDLSDFDADGWAPMTEEKRLVTAAGRSAMEAWVADLVEDPDSALMPLLAKAKVATTEQLAMSYLAGDPQGRPTPGLKNTLGQKLTDAGVKRVEISYEGKKARVWVLYPQLELTNDEIRKELNRFKGKV